MAEKPLQVPRAKPAPTSPPVQSLMNLFAVALAEGSGDPAVKQRVLENLAQQRARVEDAVRREEDFNASVQMTVFQKDLAVQQAKELEQLPSAQLRRRQSEAEVKVSEFEASPEQLAARGQKTEQELKKGAQDIAAGEREVALAPLIKQRAELDVKAAKLKLQEEEFANDPARLAEVYKDQRDLAHAQIENFRATAAASQTKAAGGGRQLTFANAFTVQGQDISKFGETAAQKVAGARQLFDLANAPSWLLDSDMTDDLKVKVARTVSEYGAELLSGTGEVYEQQEAANAIKAVALQHKQLLPALVDDIVEDYISSGLVKLTGDAVADGESVKQAAALALRKLEALTGLNAAELLGEVNGTSTTPTTGAGGTVGGTGPTVPATGPPAP